MDQERSAVIPEEIIFTLSYKCNLRCKTCYLFLKDGMHVAPQIRDDMPAARWEQILDEVAPHKPRIYFVGGEPLIFKGILELISRAADHGLYTYLCSNGTMMRHVARELVATGINRIEISLDGLEDTHDWIRGEGVFRRTMAGIESLREERRIQGRTDLQIGLAVLMCHHNIDHLIPLYDLAQENGLNFLKYQYMMFNEKANIEKDRQEFLDIFGVDSPVMEGYLDILERDLDLAQLTQVVTALGRRPAPPEVTFFPEVPDTRAYYADLGHRFPRQACSFSSRVARILPNGDVPVCFGHADFRAGNVKERPLLEIFAGDTMTRFRQALAERGLFPGCLRCSQRHYGEAAPAPTPGEDDRER